ncbi:MAG: hypothetical protein V8T01_02520 [Oscillospiraceae bacterium]
MAAAFAQRGYKLAGFDAKVKSTVLPGSGLSSSAAFEVLIGRILNGLFADNAVSAIEIAQIGQYAENVYLRQAVRPDGSDGVERRRSGVHRLQRPENADRREGRLRLCTFRLYPLHH